MKDGYYLSTYLHLDPFINLIDSVNEKGSKDDLHLFSKRHDQNMCLFLKKDNHISLIQYWEMERLTGIKEHMRSFSDQPQVVDIINFLLKPLDLCYSDLVEIWGTPELQTCDQYHSLATIPLHSYHSISHLFSSILLDSEKFFNGKILGFSVDGSPDNVIDSRVFKDNKSYYTGCFVEKGEVEYFSVYSPAALWGIASRYFNLKEGTLMALASASKSEAFLPQEEALPMFGGKNDNSAKNFLDSTINRIERIISEKNRESYNFFDPNFSLHENKISMVMKEVQKMSIRIMDKNISNAIKRYNIKIEETYLALSGGYALNCPTNSYLMKKYKFKGFIAPPCVNDSGLSLGMGLYGFYNKINKPFTFHLSHPYHGESDNRFDEIIKSENFHPFIKSTSSLQVDQVLKDLEEAPIVWFQGKAEIGPRALGNRSILADPRKIEMKDKLNEIKEREWWRPVAPIILSEHVTEWFEDAYESPYMLHTFKVIEEKTTLVPAALHLDGSARVQTITKEINPTLYDIIDRFKTNTGVPMLCNTSLNDKGEPIINKIEEALNFALRKGLKIVYINGVRLELTNHENYSLDTPFPRSVRTNKFSKEETLRQWNSLNPYNIPPGVLKYFSSNGLEDYDITKKSDVKRLLREFEIVQARSDYKIDVGKIY